jgi:hypothetical protein
MNGRRWISLLNFVASDNDEEPDGLLRIFYFWE